MGIQFKQICGIVCIDARVSRKLKIAFKPIVTTEYGKKDSYVDYHCGCSSGFVFVCVHYPITSHGQHQKGRQMPLIESLCLAFWNLYDFEISYLFRIRIENKPAARNHRLLLLSQWRSNMFLFGLMNDDVNAFKLMRIIIFVGARCLWFARTFRFLLFVVFVLAINSFVNRPRLDMFACSLNTFSSRPRNVCDDLHTFDALLAHTHTQTSRCVAIIFNDAVNYALQKECLECSLLCTRRRPTEQYAHFISNLLKS